MVNGTEIVSIAIGVGFGMLIAVAFLPSALTQWYDATQAGGDLENMSDTFKTVWNIAPIAVVLAIVGVIISLAMSKLKQMND